MSISSKRSTELIKKKRELFWEYKDQDVSNTAFILALMIFLPENHCISVAVRHVVYFKIYSRKVAWMHDRLQ